MSQTGQFGPVKDRVSLCGKRFVVPWPALPVS